LPASNGFLVLGRGETYLRVNDGWYYYQVASFNALNIYGRNSGTAVSTAAIKIVDPTQGIRNAQ
jgi:hypothetical protein